MAAACSELPPVYEIFQNRNQFFNTLTQLKHPFVTSYKIVCVAYYIPSLADTTPSNYGLGPVGEKIPAHKLLAEVRKANFMAQTIANIKSQDPHVQITKYCLIVNFTIPVKVTREEAIEQESRGSLEYWAIQEQTLSYEITSASEAARFFFEKNDFFTQT